MKDRKHGRAPSGAKTVRDAEAAAHARTADEDCRCKEVSKKSLRDLLRMMLNDFLPGKKR